MNATTFKSRLQKLGLLIFLSLIGLFGIFYLVRMSMVAVFCSTDVRRISSPDGIDYAAVEDRFCDNLGGSDVVTVSVHTSGADSPIFVYEPSSFSGPISVKWVGPRTIDVDIERVAGIEKQMHDVNGISIHYHVGAVGLVIERPRPR